MSCKRSLAPAYFYRYPTSTRRTSAACRNRLCSSYVTKGTPVRPTRLPPVAHRSFLSLVTASLCLPLSTPYPSTGFPSLYLQFFVPPSLSPSFAHTCLIFCLPFLSLLPLVPSPVPVLSYLLPSSWSVRPWVLYHRLGPVVAHPAPHVPSPLCPPFLSVLFPLSFILSPSSLPSCLSPVCLPSLFLCLPSLTPSTSFLGTSLPPSRPTPRRPFPFLNRLLTLSPRPGVFSHSVPSPGRPSVLFPSLGHPFRFGGFCSGTLLSSLPRSSSLTPLFLRSTTTP